jgi:hypothetical protein
MTPFMVPRLVSIAGWYPLSDGYQHRLADR